MDDDRDRSDRLRPGVLLDVDGTLARSQAFTDTGRDGVETASIHRPIGIPRGRRRRGHDVGRRGRGQTRTGPADRRGRAARAGPGGARSSSATRWDVEAKRAAGLPRIGLTCGGISEAELREAGAVAVCADPADLLDRFDDTPPSRAVRTILRLSPAAGRAMLPA